MSDETEIVLRSEKITGIITGLSELYHLSLEEAANIYYTSETAILIEEGIADLHCRSEKYLATLVWEEHQDSKHSA